VKLGDTCHDGGPVVPLQVANSQSSVLACLPFWAKAIGRVPATDPIIGAVSARLRRISFVQQGVIVQNEFAKFLMMGSLGLLELAAPLTDEERRDFEVHMHNVHGVPLGFQVKSVMQLARLSKNSLWLRTFFSVRAGRVVNDPLFWYFIAFLDPKTMCLADPTFLVPAAVLHREASPIKKGGFWNFTFEASMEPGAHDKFAPYRVNTLDLGQKVLSLMKDGETVSRSFPTPPLGEGWGGGMVFAYCA
jgi:hypothetical protein